MIAGLLRKLGLGEKASPAGGYRFNDFADRFRQRIATWPNGSAAPNGAIVGIVVTPWLCTATPFFSLECALELARHGANPVLLWDRANVFCNAAKSSEVAAVEQVIDALRTRFRVIELSEVKASSAVDTAFLDRLVYENAVRQMRGEERAPEFLAKNVELSEQMRAHAAHIDGLLASERFDWLLIPGGVWAASGLWSQIAVARQVPFTTFDSGVGTLFVDHSGAAAHFGDVPLAFKKLLAETPTEQRAQLSAQAHDELRRRMAGLDEYKLQPHASGAAAPKCDLLVPLNYRSDTAALCRQRAFKSVTDWLTQLLDWADARGDVTVAVRQHPCEKIPAYRGTDEWREILAPHLARLGERLHFIAAEDPVNTYDLLANCRAMLPWTSRTGIEAAMLGKPVVLGTDCYYRGCDFTVDASTPAEYFAALEDALAGHIEVSAKAREEAALVYFLMEKRLALRTNFTPQPTDFQEWVERAPDELWNDAPQALLREALLTRETVPWLQHARALSK